MRIPRFILIGSAASAATLTLDFTNGNAPIINITGAYITGTFDYIVLSGADVATATFLQAGADLVLDSNGEGTITLTGSPSSDDPMIVILQSQSTNTIIGAYEAVVD